MRTFVVVVHQAKIGPNCARVICITISVKSVQDPMHKLVRKRTTPIGDVGNHHNPLVKNVTASHLPPNLLGVWTQGTGRTVVERNRKRTTSG